MRKKLLFISIIIALFLLFTSIFFIYYSYQEEETTNSCIDINNMGLFEYDACYDAFSGNIYFELKKSKSSYNINKINITFFDFFENNYLIENLPIQGQSKFVKLSAQRNPLTLKIYLTDENINSCNNPKLLALNYCPSELSEDDRNITLNLINDISLETFEEIEQDKSTEDTLDTSFVNYESVWENICKPNWECGDWQECIDGYENRECIDKNNCPAPINMPQRVRYCNETCIEDWTCTWTKCIDGYSTPTCTDENNCGTQIDKPKKIPCGNTKCTPKIECSDWSSCNPDYNFITLSNNEYFYQGIQTRTCTDTNKCATPIIEKKDCSTVVDVFSQSYEKCGREYIGIYNKLNNQLIASVEKGRLNENSLNIDISENQNKNYCDYCFNGIKDGDETEIDCGGSCPSCEERIVLPDYGITIFERITDGFIKFIS